MTSNKSFALTQTRKRRVVHCPQIKNSIFFSLKERFNLIHKHPPSLSLPLWEDSFLVQNFNSKTMSQRDIRNIASKKNVSNERTNNFDIKSDGLHPLQGACRRHRLMFLSYLCFYLSFPPPSSLSKKQQKHTYFLKVTMTINQSKVILTLRKIPKESKISGRELGKGTGLSITSRTDSWLILACAPSVPQMEE